MTGHFGQVDCLPSGVRSWYNWIFKQEGHCPRKWIKKGSVDINSLWHHYTLLGICKSLKLNCIHCTCTCTCMLHKCRLNYAQVMIQSSGYLNRKGIVPERGFLKRDQLIFIHCDIDHYCIGNMYWLLKGIMPLNIENKHIQNSIFKSHLTLMPPPSQAITIFLNSILMHTVQPSIWDILIIFSPKFIDLWPFMPSCHIKLFACQIIPFLLDQIKLSLGHSWLLLLIDQ